MQAASAAAVLRDQPASSGVEELLLNRREASTYLRDQHGVRVSVSVLGTHAVRGGGPSITYFGSKPLYAKADLDAWVASKMKRGIKSTADLEWA